MRMSKFLYSRLNQSIPPLPMSAQVMQCAGKLFSSNFRIGSGGHQGGFTLGLLQDIAIAQQVGHTEARHPRLTRTEELARATQLQIEFGDLEAVGGAHHGIEALLAFLRDFPAGHEHTERLGRAAADAST